MSSPVNKSTQWHVEFYVLLDGSSPVADFIERQSYGNQAKIYAELDDMAEFGTVQRGDKLRHLEGELWELRFRGDRVSFRFIYFVQPGKRIVVLHCFLKKTQKTPKRELEVAWHRFDDYLERHKL